MIVKWRIIGQNPNRIIVDIQAGNCGLNYDGLPFVCNDPMKWR